MTEISRGLPYCVFHYVELPIPSHEILVLVVMAIAFTERSKVHPPAGRIPPMKYSQLFTNSPSPPVPEIHPQSPHHPSIHLHTYIRTYQARSLPPYSHLWYPDEDHRNISLKDNRDKEQLVFLVLKPTLWITELGVWNRDVLYCRIHIQHRCVYLDFSYTHTHNLTLYLHPPRDNPSGHETTRNLKSHALPRKHPSKSSRHCLDPLRSLFSPLHIHSLTLLAPLSSYVSTSCLVFSPISSLPLYLYRRSWLDDSVIALWVEMRRRMDGWMDE